MRFDVRRLRDVLRVASLVVGVGVYWLMCVVVGLLLGVLLVGPIAVLWSFVA